MKITKSRLKEIIKEEYSSILNEAPIAGEPIPYDYVPQMATIVASMGKIDALLQAEVPIGDEQVERYLKPMVDRFINIFTSRPELQALLIEKGISVSTPAQDINP